jgi:hypothetical protein
MRHALLWLLGLAIGSVLVVAALLVKEDWLSVVLLFAALAFGGWYNFALASRQHALRSKEKNR